MEVQPVGDSAGVFGAAAGAGAAAVVLSFVCIRFRQQHTVLYLNARACPTTCYSLLQHLRKLQMPMPRPTQWPCWLRRSPSGSF